MHFLKPLFSVEGPSSWYLERLARFHVAVLFEIPYGDLCTFTGNAELLVDVSTSWSVASNSWLSDLWQIVRIMTYGIKVSDGTRVN